MSWNLLLVLQPIPPFSSPNFLLYKRKKLSPQGKKSLGVGKEKKQKTDFALGHRAGWSKLEPRSPDSPTWALLQPLVL